MKPIQVILLLGSLLINALLVGGILNTKKESDSPAQASEGTQEIKSPGPVLVRTGETRTVIIQNPGEKFAWRQIESADYRAYIERLRSVDCPEETIRDIIMSDINKHYARKMKALASANKKDFKFWESRDWWEQND